MRIADNAPPNLSCWTAAKNRFEYALETWMTANFERNPSLLDVVQYSMRTGHRTRPVSSLLAATLVSVDAPSERSSNFALMVELAHKSSVIRDDIADESDTRSGQTAVHLEFGAAKAIAVSDLLLAHANSIAGHLGVSDLFNNLFLSMAVGQANDVCHSDVRNLHDALAVNDDKTANLASFATGGAARVMGATPDEERRLHDYGRAIGRSFQLINDLHDFVPPRGSLRPAGQEMATGRLTAASYLLLDLLPAQDQADWKRAAATGRVPHSTRTRIIAAVNTAPLADIVANRVVGWLEEARAALAVFNDCPAKHSLVWPTLSLTNGARVAF